MRSCATASVGRGSGRTVPASTAGAGRAVFTAGVMIALALGPSMTVAGMAAAAGDFDLAAEGLMRRAVDAAAVMTRPSRSNENSVRSNGAVTTVFAWSWDVEPDEFRRATEVTYLGQVQGTLAALARMRPRDAATPPDRPRNLWHPVDDDRDYGARGSFGHQAGGTLGQTFLRQLPQTLRQATAAAAATMRGKLRVGSSS